MKAKTISSAAAETMAVVHQMALLLVPLRYSIFLAMILGTATVGASVGLMGSAAWLIATAALHPSIADLQIAIVGVRFFGISRGVFRYTERLTSHNLTFKFLARLRVWFIEALAPLSPARLLDHSLGDLVDRAVSDIETLQSLTIRVLSPPLVALVIGLAVGLFLTCFSTGAAAIFVFFYILAAAVLPAATWVSAISQGTESVKLRSSLGAAIIDFVQGNFELQAFNQSAAYRTKIDKLQRGLSEVERRSATTDAVATGTGLLLTHLTAVGILIVGIPLVRSGDLSGVMLAVLCLVSVAAFEAALPLPHAVRHLHHQVASALRLFEILDAKPSVLSPLAASLAPWTQPGGQSPTLIFERVCHTYPGSSRPAIIDFDCRIKSGDRVAIVGPSGAGKSTLAHLIHRFWDPEAGRILVGATDIKQMNLEDLRTSTGLVAQSTFLFNGTINQNLLMAKPDASADEVRLACHQAALTSTLDGFPDGLETWIAEFGQRLSGGQRQRLGVARMLLQRPSLLVLDEPTAQLDGPTALALLQEIFRAFDGTTTLHITHRLVMMETYDTIVVLDQGRLVQQGLHSTLVAGDGLYRRLWNAEHSIL